MLIKFNLTISSAGFLGLVQILGFWALENLSRRGARPTGRVPGRVFSSGFVLYYLSRPGARPAGCVPGRDFSSGFVLQGSSRAGARPGGRVPSCVFSLTSPCACISAMKPT